MPFTDLMFTPFLAKALATRPISPGRCVRGMVKSRMDVSSDSCQLPAASHWPLATAFGISDLGIRVGIDPASTPGAAQEGHESRQQGGFGGRIRQPVVAGDQSGLLN